jgi:hypothetical protein
MFEFGGRLRWLKGTSFHRILSAIFRFNRQRVFCYLRIRSAIDELAALPSEGRCK